MRQNDEARGAAICTCGCRYFVWWICDQRRYSSRTLHEDFDAGCHPDPRCLRCNRKWPGGEARPARQLWYRVSVNLEKLILACLKSPIGSLALAVILLYLITVILEICI